MGELGFGAAALLALAACSEHVDRMASVAQPTTSPVPVTCVVGLDDGGAHSYTSCTGATGDVTTSWTDDAGVHHWCDPEPAGWQTGCSPEGCTWTACGPGTACVVVDQGVPENARDTFYGRCR